LVTFKKPFDSDLFDQMGGNSNWKIEKKMKVMFDENTKKSRVFASLEFKGEYFRNQYTF
jgi:hypothetical protein